MHLKVFGLNPESAVTSLTSGFHSDHYGFVTFYNMDDAFSAIDNGSKLRRPDELPFDLCFGGRRQFCNSDYADLGELRRRPTFSTCFTVCVCVS